MIIFNIKNMKFFICVINAIEKSLSYILNLKKMKVLFITNDLHDALNSRVKFKNWFEKQNNYSFIIVAPANTKNKFPEISLTLNKRGVTFSNIISVNKYVNDIHFDTIVFRGIENIILSLFVRNNKSKFIFLLTGLGRPFSDKLVLKKLIKKIYRNVLKFLIKVKNAKLIVQNIEDANDLGFSNIDIINGSGFPTKNYKKLEFNKPSIITASRLTKSKGLDDIIKLSELIIKNKLNVFYYVLGDYSSLNRKYYNKIIDLNKHPNINFLGFKNDISPYVSKSNFAYYPTKYREGVPRFLIESLSNGLILFTNSMPGCSLTVSNENGFLDLSSSEVLNKILNMDLKEISMYSKKSRMLFENVYADKIVYPKYLNQMINNEK